MYGRREETENGEGEGSKKEKKGAIVRNNRVLDREDHRRGRWEKGSTVLKKSNDKGGVEGWVMRYFRLKPVIRKEIIP